ncbi:MAG: hypothetical protein DRN81_05725 [Thermoproteota archaeon]|nr:MAG: hypothetical protein DRN81_05725 [Candidatus Korarchaeota archaeon]RLI82211.1 MAG: hypothetical protein DRP01_10150 [Archaeoglobales archaeon]
MYVLVREHNSRCSLFLAETFRQNGKVKQRKIYLGTLPKDVVPTAKRALLEGLGTTLDSWRAYALWYWGRALGEAKRRGDVERFSYAKKFLKWLLRRCSK